MKNTSDSLALLIEKKTLQLSIQEEQIRILNLAQSQIHSKVDFVDNLIKENEFTEEKCTRFDLITRSRFTYYPQLLKMKNQLILQKIDIDTKTEKQLRQLQELQMDIKRITKLQEKSLGKEKNQQDLQEQMMADSSSLQIFLHHSQRR